MMTDYDLEELVYIYQQLKRWRLWGHKLSESQDAKASHLLHELKNLIEDIEGELGTALLENEKND